MKKLVALFAVFAMSFCATNYVQAAPVQTAKNLGVIQVRSSASKEVSPNVVKVSFPVETTSKTLASANLDNKTNTSKLVNALKAKLNTANGDFIQTSDYRVQPNYSYNQKDKAKIYSYTVVSSVDVTIHNVENIASFIDTALANGANKVDDLRFSLDNEQSICNDLYPQVVKNAQGQASIIAKALNVNLAGVKSINTSSVVRYPSQNVNVRVLSESKALTADNVSTPIESGKIKVEASVTAEFYVQ